MRRRRLLAWLLLAMAAAGCGDRRRDGLVDFERMRNQPRGKPYAASPVFADGALMRQPPAGTVAADAPSDDGRPPITDALMRRGRNRFDVYCATCHGLDGSGRSMVGAAMRLRPPPSLVEPPVRSLPPDSLVRVMTDGYGLMRSYAAELPPDDRWAVAAYVRALRLSAHIAVDSLSAGARARAMAALGPRAAGGGGRP